MEKPSEEQLQAYFKDYEHYRELGIDLVHKIPLNKKALQECGKKLGLLEGKQLAFNNENDMSVLHDYIIFYHYMGNQNAIERLFKKRQAAPDSDEHRLFQAFLSAFYSILMVKEKYPGYGVWMQDILRDKYFLVIDKGLSTSSLPGLLLASTLINLGDYCMTSGAGLLVPPKVFQTHLGHEIAKFLKHTKATDDVHIFSPRQEANLAAKTIRLLLQAQVSDRMKFAENP